MKSEDQDHADQSIFHSVTPITGRPVYVCVRVCESVCVCDVTSLFISPTQFNSEQVTYTELHSNMPEHLVSPHTNMHQNTICVT